MFRWIRWSGIALFILITITVAVFLAVFANGLVKNTIESAGTEALETKVDLSASSLRFTPVGFELFNLQVAHPDQPMQNAVQVGTIRLAMDPTEMMRMKIVINQIDITDVQFGTPRKKSGAVKKTVPVTTKPQPPLELPKLETPDIKSLLEKEPLESVKLAQQLRTQAMDFKKDWDLQLKSLPDENTLRAYETQFKQIDLTPKGDALAKIQSYSDAQKQLKQIKKNLDNDIEKLKSQRAQFRHQWTEVKENWKLLEKAPRVDFERLAKKYSTDFEGLSNLSRTFFGRQLDGWIEQAKYWYARAAPYLEPKPQIPPPPPSALDGVTITYKETHPIPDFLLRQGMLSVVLPFGTIKGTLHDISSDQAMLGHPGVIDIRAEKLQGVQDIRFNAQLLPAQSLQTKLNLTVSGLRFEKIALVKEKDFPLDLAGGIVDINVDGDVSLSKLATNLRFDFNNTKIQLRNQADNKWLQALASAFTRINRFSVQANAIGSLDDYKMTVRSDLDRIFNDALGQEFKAQVTRFRGDLDKRVTEQFNDKLKELKLSQYIGELDSVDKLFQSRESFAEALRQTYENQLKQAIDKQANEEKAQLDRKKAEEQKKLQDKANKEKDKLKEKLKEKLKL